MAHGGMVRTLTMHREMFVLLFKFHVERGLWVTVVVLTVASMLHHLSAMWSEHRENHQIVTRVQLRPAEEVPFPTLTLSVGDPVDPLGFVRNTKSVLKDSDLNGTDMHEMKDAIFRKVYVALSSELKWFLERNKDVARNLTLQGLAALTSIDALWRLHLEGGRIGVLRAYVDGLSKRSGEEIVGNFLDILGMKFELDFHSPQSKMRFEYEFLETAWTRSTNVLSSSNLEDMKMVLICGLIPRMFQLSPFIFPNSFYSAMVSQKMAHSSLQTGMPPLTWLRSFLLTPSH